MLSKPVLPTPLPKQLSLITQITPLFMQLMTTLRPIPSREDLSAQITPFIAGTSMAALRPYDCVCPCVW